MAAGAAFTPFARGDMCLSGEAVERMGKRAAPRFALNLLSRLVSICENRLGLGLDIPTSQWK